MTEVEFPYMRLNVVDALESLAASGRDGANWQFDPERPNYYDDLTLNVHILYDDTAVLPDPSHTVGSVLFREDVAALEALGDILTPLIDELGEAPDSVYLSSPQWDEVLAAAQFALNDLTSRGDVEGLRRR